jgi:uncharacterized membrane protein
MDVSNTRPGEETTHDERANALLAYVLSIFAGFIAPGIIYLVKRRDSRFVAFHAMQAFLWHTLFFLVAVAGFVAFAVFMVVVAAKASASPPGPLAPDGGPPVAVFLGFFGVWSVIMLGWLANVGSCIYLAIRASEGKWTRYPLVGSLAMRWA